MARDEKPISDGDERLLRRLIAGKRTPIYIGDSVRVSSRFAGDSRNPHEGKVGVVVAMECGLQGAFNSDYLIYSVVDADGREEPFFQTWHYTLDRIGQTERNKLLEKSLREEVTK